MIRVFMPDGRREKLRGKFRIRVSSERPPILTVEHKGNVRSIDSIAMVFRGSNIAYTPLAVVPFLRESDRAFLAKHQDWGSVDESGSMPMCVQPVKPYAGEVQAGDLAKEMTDRLFDGSAV